MRDDSKKLVAMDLDGTLTQHKSPLEPECRQVLEELSLHYRLLMVCAGGCERVYVQMGRYPIDIIGFYGMQTSTIIYGELVIVDNHTVKIDRDTVLDRVMAIREEFGFCDYAGESVEFHSSGLITFPILGTMAPFDKKLAYDPDRTKRRQYFGKVRDVFGDYTVFIGGTSSFDIAPRPYNKLYAIDNYLKSAGLMREDVIYFGDDYGLGGNDSDVFESGIEFVCIDNYRGFPLKAKKKLL